MKCGEPAYPGPQSNKPPCNAFQDGSIINSVTENTPFYLEESIVCFTNHPDKSCMHGGKHTPVAFKINTYPLFPIWGAGTGDWCGFLAAPMFDSRSICVSVVNTETV